MNYSLCLPGIHLIFYIAYEVSFSSPLLSSPLTNPQLRLLEPFQRGEIPTFIAHIEEGLRVFNEYDQTEGTGKGLLVFSG